MNSVWILCIHYIIQMYYFFYIEKNEEISRNTPWMGKWEQHQIKFQAFISMNNWNR